jgi:putative PIN family toxin of toxin-antitoxin system
MRIVVDTNVLVRSTPASIGGPAWELLEHISRAGHVLVLSAPLIAELADVLRRPRFQSAIGLTSQQASRFLSSLQDISDVIDLSGTPAIEIPHDPKDVAVVLTAIAGKAETICTLDRHLFHSQVLALCQAHGIRVMSDLDLLSELRQGGVA